MMTAREETDDDPVFNEVCSLVPPLDQKDWRIRGLVESAVCSGSLKSLFLLKAKGVDFRRRLPSAGGCTLMHRAANMGRIDSIMFLYREGLYIDDKMPIWGVTPLHEAVKNNHVDAAKLLLLLGAKIDEPEHRGRAPLHYAIEHNAELAGIFLVMAGAALTTKDSTGHTPLTLAQSQGCSELTNCLFRAIMHTSHCWNCRQVSESNVID